MGRDLLGPYVAFRLEPQKTHSSSPVFHRIPEKTISPTPVSHFLSCWDVFFLSHLKSWAQSPVYRLYLWPLVQI